MQRGMNLRHMPAPTVQAPMAVKENNNNNAEAEEHDDDATAAPMAVDNNDDLEEGENNPIPPAAPVVNLNLEAIRIGKPNNSILNGNREAAMKRLIEL